MHPQTKAFRKAQSVKRNLITLCALCFALFSTPAIALACTTGSCGTGRFCAIDTRIPGGSACYLSCTSSDAAACSPAERCISVTGHEVCAPNDSPLVTGVTPPFSCTCMIGSAPVGTAGTFVSNDCASSDDVIAAYSVAPLANITNTTVPSGPLLSGETQVTKCRAICVIVGDRANTESLGSSARCLRSTVAAASASAATAPAAPEQAFEAIVPVLGTEVPGLTFTPATKNGDSVSVPYIAQYVNAGYRYLVSVILIVSIVMVVYGGFRYLVAASIGDVKNGKKIIVDALMGMLITLGAFMILNTVNPATTDLTTLDLAFVSKIPMDSLLEDVGNAADDSSYADGGAVDVPPGAPGTWRSRMLDRSLCIGNGQSLPTQTEKVGALRRIVDTWKHIGIDEGGAIYVRGGRADCRDVSLAEPRQVAFFVTTLTTASDAQLSGAGINESCLAPIRQLRTIANRNARIEQGKTVASTKGSECRGMWQAAYNRFTTGLARDRGLFCGDCASTVAQIYSCFDRHAGGTVLTKRPATNVCEPRGSEGDYVFFLRRPATQGAAIGQEALDRVIGNLHFGDVIAFCKTGTGNTGHVFMYTGGVGLPYEILEMGAGGGGPAIGSGSALAMRNAGTPLSISGMKASASARVFLGNIVKRSDIASLSSWRIISP